MSEIKGSCKWLVHPDELTGIGLLDISGDEYRIRLVFTDGVLTLAECNEYRVSPAPGRWRCTCADWIHRRQHSTKGCKHCCGIRAACSVLELRIPQ